MPVAQCTTCSREIPADSRLCPYCGTAVGSETASPTEAIPPGDLWGPAETAEHGRFPPGTRLEGRYRVVGLLGRGGMGEVYRADDLKLGQTVALKFLSKAVERDRDRIARLLNEVRVALRVTHPHVCRVHDIGEVDSHHYISMEYIDGEDLASLLRRVGRLPGDRAIEAARQLCAGLAAAHDEGILHRDLKPANVMIDGRGRVKITDFGLASLAAELPSDEIRAGTPAYMAPEQLAGERVTERSDIYSLGLLLYEMFTGQRALEGQTPAEIAQRQDDTPTSPSSIVDGLDPAVENVILRCLDKEPSDRPASARAVAAALPGGDPLAAAVAAGETPSPALVAAAGEQVELPRWQPWTAIAFFAVGLVPVVWLSGLSMLHNRIDLEIPPGAFEDRARSIAKELGHDEPPTNRTLGLHSDPDYFQRIVEAPDLESQQRLLAAATSPVRWWYRESPESLAPDAAMSYRPSMDDPGWDAPGMLGVVMDSNGHLVELHRRPTQSEAFAAAATRAPTVDWSIWLDRAGLDPARFAPVAAERTPPVYADEVLAWEGEAAAYPGARIRVRAAALGGRPVRFVIEPSWELAAQPPPGIPYGAIAIPVVFFAAVFFARRNLRADRGDRRGARRLVWAVLVWFVAIWSFGAYHTPESTFHQLVLCIGTAMLFGGLVWLIYMASEPFVRRRWPDLLVSWARLVEGRWRDPLVGRDLVIGAAFAVALAGFDQLAIVAPTWFGRAQQFEHFQAPFPLEGLLGARMAVGQILPFLTIFFLVLFSLLLLVLVRLVTRRTWAAFVASTLGLFLFFAMTPQNRGAGIVFLLAFSLAQVSLLMRFGLLAASTAMLLHSPLAHGPMTPDLGAWYGSFSIVTLVLVVAVAGYGFVTSFGGRPVIAEGAWEEP